MSNLNFNAEEVEPSQSDFTPLPAGEYLAMVISSDVMPTKSGDGLKLNLTLQIIDGHYKNRLVFDLINIQNPNATAQKIGQQTLAALCHAVGVLQVQDSSQLHNTPMIVRLAVSKDEKWGERNEVKAYKSANGVKPGVSTRPAAQQPTHQPTHQPSQPAAPYNAGSYAEKYNGPKQNVPAKQAAPGAAAKPAWAK